MENCGVITTLLYCAPASYIGHYVCSTSKLCYHPSISKISISDLLLIIPMIKNLPQRMDSFLIVFSLLKQIIMFVLYFAIGTTFNFLSYALIIYIFDCDKIPKRVKWLKFPFIILHIIIYCWCIQSGLKTKHDADWPSVISLAMVFNLFPILAGSIPSGLFVTIMLHFIMRISTWVIQMDDVPIDLLPLSILIGYIIMILSSTDFHISLSLLDNLISSSIMV